MIVLNKGAAKLKEDAVNTHIENDAFCNAITNLIYNACRASYKKKCDLDNNDNDRNLANLKNCNSKNFKAIAHANRVSFELLKEQGIDNEETTSY